MKERNIFMMKIHFVCLCTAALCLGGCAGNPNPVTPKNEPPAAEIASPARSFRPSDKLRAKRQSEAERSKQVERTLEERLEDKKFESRLYVARTKVRQKDYDGAEQILAELDRDTRAAAYLHALIPVIRVDSLMRRERYSEAAQLAGSNAARSELNTIQRAALRQLEINAYLRIARPLDAVKAGFARLAEGLDEREAYYTKRQIIQQLDRAGAHAEAIALCRELADGIGIPLFQKWMIFNKKDPGKLQLQELGLSEKVDVLTSLWELYAADQNIREMLRVSGEIFECVDDPERRAVFELGNARVHAKLGQPEDAEKLRLAVMNNEKLSAAMRVRAFLELAQGLSALRGSDPKRIPELAEIVLRIQKLPGEEYGKILRVLMQNAKEKLKDNAAVLAFAKSLVTYPDVANADAVAAAWELAEQDAANGRFEAASEQMSSQLARKDLAEKDRLDIYYGLAQILAWQEKYDEAIAFLRTKLTAGKGDGVYALIAQIHLYFHNADAAAKAYREGGDRLAEIRTLYTNGQPAKAKLLARELLEDEAWPNTRERAGAYDFFMDGTEPADREIRRKYKSFYLKNVVGPGTFWNTLRSALKDGAYPLAAECTEAIAEKPELGPRDLALFGLYAAYAEGAVGKCETASRIIRNLLDRTPGFTPDERAALRYADAVMRSPDRPGEIAKFLPEISLDGGRKAKLIIRAGRIAMTAKKFSVAKDLEKQYNALFKPEPRKVYNLAFSDRPVLGLTGFLALEKAPVKQKLDRKYGGNMEFLETDVFTGDRGKNIGSEKGKNTASVEFQAVCDEFGIHLLFTAHDPRSREIEAGLAQAGSYEMYLAPGSNQPYTCLLPDPSSRVTYLAHTTYNNEFNHRIDPAPEKNALRTEYEFGDSYYRTYVFLNWKTFYDKLPEGTDSWEFDNIQWGRAGGYSWNGVKTIHGRSTWGLLRFDISENQRRKIKRQIIFAARKNYLAEKLTDRKGLGEADLWKSDPVLGDEKFYRECAAPLLDRLDSFLPLVQTDMDAKTIDRLYQRAVHGWFDIRAILQTMRRDYLREKIGSQE